MTADANRHPPPVPPGHWVECPLCHEFFRNEQARGSHLHYVHHQDSTRKVRPRFETPEQGVPKAAAVDAPNAEALKGLATRKPDPPSREAPKRQTPPTAPSSISVQRPHESDPSPRTQMHRASQSVPEAPAPAAPKQEVTRSPLTSQPKEILDRSQERPSSSPVSTFKQAKLPTSDDSPPSACPAAPTTPKPDPSGAGMWAALGIGVGSLAALIISNKGKNAPRPSQPDTATQPARPPAALPEGIWAKPEPTPTTTGNAWLDGQLGYSGGIRPRRRWL